MEWMNETSNGIEIHFRVIPRASKNEIQGVHDGTLKVRLTSPPVDGKANQALIKLLGKTLNIAKKQIKIKRGETSRNKTVLITGATKDQIMKKIRL